MGHVNTGVCISNIAYLLIRQDTPRGTRAFDNAGE